MVQVNGVTNFFVGRMSSEEFTAAWLEKRAMRRMEGAYSARCTAALFLKPSPRLAPQHQIACQRDAGQLPWGIRPQSTPPAADVTPAETAMQKLACIPFELAHDYNIGGQSCDAGCDGVALACAGLSWDELDMRTILVDPPRAGLDAETLQLLRRFDRCELLWKDRRPQQSPCQGRQPRY